MGGRRQPPAPGARFTPPVAYAGSVAFDRDEDAGTLAAVALLLAATPQLEQAWDSWQAERYRRGETAQRPGYTDNPFRPR